MRTLLLLLLILVLAAPAGGADSPYGAIGTGPVTITIRNKGDRSFFTGPARVSAGSRLTVVNATRPKAVGPHTFSLVRPASLPRTKKQRRACGRGVCGRIAKAHRFDRKALQVRRPDVDVGGKGWNRAFGRTGDTWYVDTKGDSETRLVTAPSGTTLTYFCATHPYMKGTITVVD